MTELPFETWVYEEQTKNKHKVFEDYFDKWVKIIGKNNPFNYIDGFGGCGAYKDKEGIHYGSPILAAMIIQKSQKKNCSIIVIDTKKKHIENIKKIKEYVGIDCKMQFAEGDFDSVINGVLDKHSKMAPTFFFIDPFGFSGIRYSTLKKIMERYQMEILLTFMFEGITRFLSLPQNEEILDGLFGTTEWKSLIGLHGNEKEDKMINLYKQQLKKITKFVFPYRIEFPSSKRTYYYLFHLTGYHKGAVIMKSSFAKFNLGRVAYVGSRANQLTLFDIENVKIETVEEFLLNKYPNERKKYLELIEENIDEVPYLESDFYKALKELEKEKKIKIVRDPPFTPVRKSPRESIQEQDTIIFIN